MLKTSNQASPDPFARTANWRSPARATGEALMESAEPLIQTSSFKSKMLLFVSVPSMVAVKFGASVTFRTMELVVGRRWNVAGVDPATEVSCHHEKPSVAAKFPRV